ncbi:hypothetical protein COSO111634_27715 [Corallococcus soli]
MPGPLSETRTSTNSPPALRRSPKRSGFSVRTVMQPFWLPIACTAFCTRLMSTCLSCSASPSARGSRRSSSTASSAVAGMSFWMSRMVRVTTSLRSVGPKLCLSGRE